MPIDEPVPAVYTVDSVSPHGATVLHSDDGSYVLAEQIDAKPLTPDQSLVGTLTDFGMNTVRDPATGTSYDFFVEAYGLSREAAIKGSS